MVETVNLGTTALVVSCIGRMAHGAKSRRERVLEALELGSGHGAAAMAELGCSCDVAPPRRAVSNGWSECRRQGYAELA